MDWQFGCTNGVLSGTPVAAGTFPITLNALDHNGTSVNSPQYSFVVNSTGTPFTITTTSLPNGVISTSYNQTLTQSGGPSSGVTWTILSGTLPAGLGISSNTNGTGAISGTPTATGTSNFTIQASYTSGSSTITASQGLSITINASASTLTMAICCCERSGRPNGVDAIYGHRRHQPLYIFRGEREHPPSGFDLECADRQGQRATHDRRRVYVHDSSDGLLESADDGHRVHVDSGHA